jgi:tetratricopeptide (TPR) repeat protein
MVNNSPAPVLFTAPSGAPPQTDEMLLDSILTQADSHFARKEWSATRVCLERAVSIAPNNAGLLNALGSLQYQQLQYSDACATFTTALKNTPDDPDLHIQLAMAQTQLGQEQQAEQSLQQSLVLRPKNSLAQELLGNLDFAAERWAAGAEHYCAAMTDNPDGISLLLCLGKCHQELRDLDSARWCFKRVLTLDSSNIIALDAMRILGGKGSTAVAAVPAVLTGRNSSITSSPDKSRGELTAAWQEISQAIALAPNRADLLSRRGHLALALNDSASAHRDFTDALAIDPRCTNALSGMASYQWQHGDPDQGEVVAERALEIDPANAVAAKVYCEIFLERHRVRPRKLNPSNYSGIFTAGTGPLDPLLLRRIKAAYRSAQGDPSLAEASMWSGINTRKKNIHDALLAESDQPLERILARPGDTHLFYGFDYCFSEGVRAMRAASKQECEAMEALVFSDLVLLAESFGAHRIFNPEQIKQKGLTPSLQAADELIEKIEKSVGCKLPFPNPFPDEFGLRTSNGIMSYRAQQAIYQASRVQKLTAKYGGRVLEIGAGQGRTAYYARCLGITDYTIVDLPMANVAQAAFLGSVLGNKNIRLTGEPESQSATVKIITPEQLFAGNREYDVVLNADSLTEMNTPVAEKYGSFARRRAKALLSINHEVNNQVVRDLASLAGTQISRHPCWMRPGYAEELFVF